MRLYPIFVFLLFVHISNFGRKICTENFMKYLCILLSSNLLHLNFSELSRIVQNYYLLIYLVCKCKRNTWVKTFYIKIYMVTIENQAMSSVDFAFIIPSLWGIIYSEIKNTRNDPWITHVKVCISTDIHR